MKTIQRLEQTIIAYDDEDTLGVLIPNQDGLKDHQIEVEQQDLNTAKRVSVSVVKGSPEQISVFLEILKEKLPRPNFCAFGMILFLYEINVM